MNQSSCDTDEDQDSLFGSPPPSPARGRSPSPDTLTAGEIRPIVPVLNAEAGRKNVGTIALPGSHMSCAELPADLLASRLLLPRPATNHDSSNVATPDIIGMPTSSHTPVATSRSFTRSVSSRPSSAASTIPPPSTRRRRKSKSKSATPIAPSITLPGPDEPTPPNFLRSQSSLLGLAGVVGCVKPAQLHAHDANSPPVRQLRSHTPIHGSTPTHPIVIDDDQDTRTPHIGKRPAGERQVPQRLDLLDPAQFRSNITTSLAKEKNLFPVLESLIKLLGGEPHLPSAPPQPFVQPYGHSVFHTQPSISTSDGSTVASIPPLKRRKLKHVPAGAADWDVPFPFAAGEGPEAYRDTWAQGRAKQLATQLLELVQNATKRAAVKTARTGKVIKRRPSAQDHQSSRSLSVETQPGQSNSVRIDACESPSYTGPNVEVAMGGASMDSLSHFLGLLEAPGMVGSSTFGSKDKMSVDLEGGSSVVPCDHSAFEEWLSQLQEFLPPETDTPTPEPDWGTQASVTLDSLTSAPPPDVVNSIQHQTRDEAIDPALLALSYNSGSAPQSHPPAAPASTVTLGNIPQLLDIPPTPPALTYSPRTSLSSLTEPLTPLSEVFADVPTSTATCQDPIYLPPHSPLEKDRRSRPGIGAQETVALSSLTEPPDPPRMTAAQKGKARADGSAASATQSTSSRSTPSTVSTSKNTLDKQAILERARERRIQLVAEIERAKIEMWETTIENAVLVHLTKDGSSRS